MDLSPTRAYGASPRPGPPSLLSSPPRRVRPEYPGPSELKQCSWLREDCTIPNRDLIHPGVAPYHSIARVGVALIAVVIRYYEL